MPTCDDVKRALAGLATGEKATPEIREHLATCDACRALRDATNDEVARVREGFAALSPSPFLEEAALDAAHRGAAEASPRRPWTYVAIAAAAAASLFLAVILPQIRTASAPVVVEEQPGEGDEATPAGPGIEIPPSEGQVDAARRINALRTDLPGVTLGPGEMAHKETTASSGATYGLVLSKEFLPPNPERHHRFVYGDAAGKPGDRTIMVRRWPRSPGMILLGSDFVDEIGGKLSRSPTTIELDGKTWTTTPGTMQGEIHLGSPDAGGAEARVRVFVDPYYSGTLLVEGPLARTLGLHQFEIPGAVRFHVGEGEREGGTVGRRARARVRIPELGVDRVIEVQTVRDRPWQTKGGGSDDEPVAVLEGESPSGILWARMIRVDGEGITARRGVKYLHKVEFKEPLGADESFAVPVREGTWQIALHFEPRPGLPQFPDKPLLGELFRGGTSTAFLRTLDCPKGALHQVKAKRVTLDGKWEPDARVTIARVWRGRVALPSREAVVMSQVRKDGTISFVRIAGEPGRTLRMLVTTKDGTSTFHDVVVAPDAEEPPRIEIPVGVFANGMVKLPGWETRVMNGPDEERMPPEESLKALVGLRDHFRSMAGRPDQRDERGVSPAELVLRVEPATRWQLIQWILQIAAEPSIAVVKIRFEPFGEPHRAQRIELPTDQGIASVQHVREVPMLTVKLFWQEDQGRTRIRVGNQYTAWSGEDITPHIRAIVRMMGRPPAGLIGEVKTPRPKGLKVPFGDVLEVIRALREVGIERIRLEGAPAPIPVRSPK